MFITPAKNFSHIARAAILPAIFSAILFAFPQPAAAQTLTEGFCDRLQSVRVAIMRKLSLRDIAGAFESDGVTPTGDGRTDCKDVTDEALETVRTLNLDDLGGRNPGPVLNVLPSNVFAGLVDLRELTLLENYEWTEIEADAFAGLVELRNLDMEEGTFTSLPADVFDGLSSLTSLNLGSTRLEELPEGIFDGLGSLNTLTLGGTRLTELPLKLFAETPFLSNLNIQVSGKNGIKLPTLPPDIFNGLVNMAELRMANIGVTEFPPGIFDGMSKLTRLHMNGNELTTLRENVFADLSSLNATFWTLNKNPYTVLPPGVFAGVETQAQKFGPPGQPQDLPPIDAAPADGMATLTWAAPAVTGEGGVTGYELRWRLPDATTFAAADAHSISGDSTLSYTITGLTKGEVYRIQVAALANYRFPRGVNTNNKTAAAISVGGNWAEAPRNAAPDPPLSITIADGDESAVVTWTAAVNTSDAPTTGYELQWRPRGSTSSSFDKSGVVNTLTHRIERLFNDAVYEVQVRAKNSYGDGNYSAPVLATPQSAPGIVHVTAVFGDGSALLHLQPPATDVVGAPATRYSLRWKRTDSASFTGTDDISIARRDYIITNIPNGATYDVEVAARSRIGDGEAFKFQVRPTSVSLNIDGMQGAAGSATQLSDLILITRHLLGARGATLTAGQTNADAPTITGNIDADKIALDVDISGASDWKDGVMIARYILGMRGDDLTADLTGAANGKLTTTPAATVEKNISALPK